VELIFAFLLEHWILSSAFLVVALLLAANEWRHYASGVKALPPQQVVDLMNHAHAVVFDMRELAAYEQKHILGAIHLLPEAINDKRTLSKYKTKPVIVVCAKGMQAGTFAKQLLAEGFSQVYSLSGGMENWLASGLPVTNK